MQVCISSRGVLKVTHMLTLAGGGVAPVEVPPLLGTFSSQVCGSLLLAHKHRMLTDVQPLPGAAAAKHIA